MSETIETDYGVSIIPSNEAAAPAASANQGPPLDSEEHILAAIKDGKATQVQLDEFREKGAVSKPVPQSETITVPPTMVDVAEKKTASAWILDDVQKGKMTLEEGNVALDELGFSKDEISAMRAPVSEEEAEFNKWHPVDTEFDSPRFMDSDSLTPAQLIESAAAFTEIFRAAEMDKGAASSLVQEIIRTAEMNERLSPSERAMESHATRSAEFMENLEGANWPKTEAILKEFMAHLRTATKGKSDTFIQVNAEAIDRSEIAFQMIVSAAKTWKARQEIRARNK